MSRTLESALHELREMWLNFPGLSFGSLSRSCIQEMSPEQADFYEQACKVALAASPGPSELVERPNPETQAVAKIRELEKEFRETAETLAGTASAAGVLACADRLSAVIRGTKT